MKVGVVVGRFQTDSLHDGHISLLTKAFDDNEFVLVFVGVSSISGTKKNPLDFVTRHQMLNSTIANFKSLEHFSIEPLKDLEDDKDWCDELDKRIEQSIKFGDELTLYGGDDSFLDCYDGKFKNDIFRLDTAPRESATHRRKSIVESVPLDSYEFRQGIIYALGNTRDTVSATVDIACVKDDKVLVGRKEGEKLWRFPGGFVDATDNSLEKAARREFGEETKLTIEGGLHYVCSNLVDDWRWRNSPDKSVITTLFACKYNFGSPIASDDLVELKWIKWHGDFDLMNSGHKPLYSSLYAWLRDTKNVF